MGIQFVVLDLEKMSFCLKGLTITFLDCVKMCSKFENNVLAKCIIIFQLMKRSFHLKYGKNLA